MAAKEPSEETPLVLKDGKKDGEQSMGAYAYQVILVGMGFLADAYDLFVIDVVLSILSRLDPAGMHPYDKSMVASATLVGAIIGQLIFGFAGDWIGRKWTFMSTCVFIILGAFLSGCVLWTEGAFTIYRQMALCRFVLGVGVGGEYPLAASVAAEGAETASRGRFIALVFSMQGWGMLLSCIFVLIFLMAEMPLEYIWRSVLIIGAIPSLIVIFMRSKMEESAIFLESQKDKEGPSFSDHLAIAKRYVRQFWRPLVGTTMTWLLLDITFYGTGSFKSRISASIVEHDGQTDEEHIWHETVFATICCCCAIPGYLLSVAFIDILGRYNIQFWGFWAMAANFFIIAYHSGKSLKEHQQWALLICFGLTFLFSNFGPNTTTFVIPVEVYPTVIRATCHGLSAAAGKLGAVIGVVAFSPCEAAFGIQTVLTACGVVCITGAIVTYFFTSDQVIDLRTIDETASKKHSMDSPETSKDA